MVKILSVMPGHNKAADQRLAHWIKHSLLLAEEMHMEFPQAVTGRATNVPAHTTVLLRGMGDFDEVSQNFCRKFDNQGQNATMPLADIIGHKWFVEPYGEIYLYAYLSHVSILRLSIIN